MIEGLPNNVAQRLDVIFSETYLPVQVRTDLERLIASELSHATHEGARVERSQIFKFIGSNALAVSAEAFMENNSANVMPYIADKLHREYERGR